MMKQQQELAGSKEDLQEKKGASLNWLVCIAKLCLFAFSFFLSTPVIAASESKRTLTYAVYAGGIHVVEAQLDIENKQKNKNDPRYKLFLSSKTRGFLGSLAPWSGTFESYGWVVKGKENYKPELHRSTAIWRGETEIKEYKYGKDGSFKGLFVTDHDKTTYKKDVKAELTKNSTDVLSATYAAMNLSAQGKGCASTAEVFDGKRRFEMLFRAKKDDGELDSPRYNVYKGKTDQCTVEVVPIAGAWHKKPRGWFSIQEQGREQGTMPTIWFGQITEGQPAVPVKVLVKTSYGALVMHLVRYNDGINKLVLKQ